MDPDNKPRPMTRRESNHQPESDWRFWFHKGTLVKVFIKGKVFERRESNGSIDERNGMPLYFSGTVHECFGTGIVIKGKFSTPTEYGHRRFVGYPTCKRINNVDIERIEVCPQPDDQ